MLKTVNHPILPWTITFNSDDHSYIDNEGRNYISVTTFISSFFPQFNEHEAAARIAARTGQLEMEIIEEWNRKRIEASIYGTNVHAYAEALMLDASLPLPATEKEQRAFTLVSRACEMILDQYDFIAAEQIIFDPLYLIAGTIDLVVRHKQTGILTIIDWKTNEMITDDCYSNGLPPLQRVKDSKKSHYELQLSLYALLLTDKNYSSYTDAGEVVQLALVHIPHVGDDPIWMPLDYKHNEAILMIDNKMKLKTHNKTLQETK